MSIGPSSTGKSDPPTISVEETLLYTESEPSCLGQSFLSFFGSEFTSGSTALSILVFGQLVNAAAGSVGLLLVMTAHEREAAIGMGVGLSLNVLLNTLLIPLWGIEGAAGASATSMIVWNLWLAVRVHRRLGLDPSVLAMFGPRAAGVER